MSFLSVFALNLIRSHGASKPLKEMVPDSGFSSPPIETYGPYRDSFSHKTLPLAKRPSPDHYLWSVCVRDQDRHTLWQFFISRYNIIIGETYAPVGSWRTNMAFVVCTVDVDTSGI